MKKIIIILTYCYFTNTYTSKNDDLNNHSNIQVYALYANYKNTLNKIVFSTEKQSALYRQDQNSICSLLLNTMTHSNKLPQNSYYGLIPEQKNDLEMRLTKGPSGFLAQSIFFNLHKTTLEEKLKIFATGAYNDPVFDKKISKILQQEDFMTNNSDDIISDNGTLYYKTSLLPKIMSQLEEEEKSEYNQKNIAIQDIGGIAIKILNWIAHCHQENTFESIVFLPKI